jgi:hypothetical protein
LTTQEAPAVVTHPEARTTRRHLMATQKSTAHPAHPSTEDQDQDHPHACNDGWVTIGQIVVDEETGEETEEYALYLCRKCAQRS